MIHLLIFAAVTVTAALLLHPRLANAPVWRATITPLASIIGSGFLVLGPVLNTAYGRYAPLVMALLCGGAYLFGSAIRFNIATIAAANGQRSPLAKRLEAASSWALAFAYIVSVAYYLNLFGAFGVNLTPWGDSFHARLLTSAILLLILAVGWTRGFKALERMEQVSVGIKLAVIAGLLAGLAAYFARRDADGDLFFNAPALGGWNAVAVAFGLIVTVQGFETSRYLKADYDPATRIRSMRMAQALSTAIYMVYIGLLTFSFPSAAVKVQETSIIGMMTVVASALPLLLVAAALSAQFSAAVADTSGAGGLFAELTRGRVSPKRAYAILVGAGLLITWSANVFQIISYASRAFALYYALQAAIAAVSARKNPRHQKYAPGYLALCLLGIAIVVFGIPVE